MKANPQYIILSPSPEMTMDDTINISIDSEQCDLIIRALQKFRRDFYEESRMDNEEETPRVRRALDIIDRLKAHLQLEIRKLYNRQ